MLILSMEKLRTKYHSMTTGGLSPPSHSRLKTNLTTDTVRALHPNRVVEKVRQRRDGDVVDRQGAESAE